LEMPRMARSGGGPSTCTPPLHCVTSAWC